MFSIEHNVFKMNEISRNRRLSGNRKILNLQIFKFINHLPNKIKKMRLKFYFTIILQIPLLLNLMACSFTPESFCTGYNMASNDLIVSGQIISIDADGISLEILEILRGDEEKETIRIWDGTDFDCNGFFSMAASDIGEINDTVLLILPKIDTLENTWDVIGDYRRPEYIKYTSSLTVKDGIITGLIKGLGIAPPSLQLTSMAYSTFINNWSISGDCSNIVVKTEEKREKIIKLEYTNPIKERLYIRVLEGRDPVKRLEVYTGEGRKIKTIAPNTTDIQINFSEYPSGIYYIKLADRKNRRKMLKVVKM